MAMELPLFLGDGPDAALFSSLWSSFPDDLQQPPQEVLFLFFNKSPISLQIMFPVQTIPSSLCYRRISLFFSLAGGRPAAATEWDGSTWMRHGRRWGSHVLAPPVSHLPLLATATVVKWG